MSKIWMANGRDYVSVRPSASLFSEIATRENAGATFSTFYNTVPNPDPVLRKTSKTIEIFDEVRRDPHVSSCTRSRKSGVLQRKWMIDVNEASPATAEIIEKSFKSMKLHKVIGEILSAWGYGYKVLEIIWVRQGNYILPKRIVGKPQSWFTFDKDNNLLRKTKENPRGEPVQPNKFLLAQYDAEYDNPYGQAEYSMCFWPVTLKKGGIKFWARFLEKFAGPHAVGKLPRNASSDDRRLLLDALTLMVQNSCSVFPDDASVELIEAAAKGSSGELYEQFLVYHNSEISKVILGHSAGADSTPGKLGNESMALEVRDDIVDGDCRMVEETLDTLISIIMQLNPNLGTEAPSFVMYQEEDVDQKTAERDKTLADTGQVKFTKKHFVKAYDFEEDEFDVVAPAAAAAAQPVALAAAPTPAVAVEGALPRPLAEINALMDRLSKEASTVDLVAPIEKLIAEATSLEDLRDRILDAFPNMQTRDLAATLGRALTAASMAGRFELSQEVKR